MFRGKPALQCSVIVNLLFISVVHMEFIIETLPICGNNQLVEVNPVNIPRIESGLYTEISNVTSMFRVGYLDNNIVGNISWSLSNDMAKIYIRLKLQVNEKSEDMKYFTPKNFQIHDSKMERSTSVNLSCILTMHTPNASLIADVFLLDRTSCDCDIIEENQGRQSCLDQCHMFLILQEEFPISKEACQVYNQYNDYNNNGPQIGVRGQRTLENVTTFIGFMRNINPYALVNIWVFPAVEPFFEPIASWEFWTNTAGEISFVETEFSHNLSMFYVKFITNCSEYGYEVFYSEDIDYEEYEISDIVPDTSPEEVSVQEHSTMLQQHRQQHNDLLLFMQTSPELVYGIVAGLAFTACVIAVVVWIKFHPYKIITCAWNSRQHVVHDCEEMLGQNLLETKNTLPALNNQTNERDDGHSADSRGNIPRAMLIHHANTIELLGIITDLKGFLTRHGVLVEEYASDLKGNLYDFAERAGSFYPHVIFVLSSGLLELLDIYRNKEPKGPKAEETNAENAEKWTKLMMDRNWNIIPCIVLEKLRILYYDRKTVFRVHLIAFSDENHEVSCEFLHSKFLTMFSGFLNAENTVCYTLKTSDLNETPTSLQNVGDIQHLIQLLLQLT